MLLPAREEAPVSRYVAPGLRRLGIFLPYTALHHLLLSSVRDKFAIMTSGNPHGEPMCTDNREAVERLRGIVDYFLVHNREIVNRVDDSVVRFTCGEVVMIRRGRGYAPTWIEVNRWFRRPVVAFGALLQNTGAIAFENKVVLTQFIGDCDDVRTLMDLDKYIRRLIDMYRVDVSNCVVACDLHPRYTTTLLAERFSERLRSKLYRIQHHWAHVTSIMAERGVDEEVIGIAIDGVGYGADGQVWGGEVMLCTYDGFRRAGHLRYVKMPGGDLAVAYPARMLISYLCNLMSPEEVRSLLARKRIIESCLRYGDKEFDVIVKQIESKSTPLTSSTGRFLDAVSTYLGVCGVRTYEGEPAIKLEERARECSEWIEIPVVHVVDEQVIDVVKAFEELIVLEGKYDVEALAYMVQYGLGRSLGRLALTARSRRHKYVVVSGGAAVNEYIVRGVRDVVERAGLKVLLPRRIPPNDGGISLGQAVIACGLIDS